MDIIITNTIKITGVIGDDVKNNGSKIWEVREGIIGKILSILGSVLLLI